MIEPAGAGAPMPRAFLGIGGVTLARHQLGLALAMDCQRIICLARAVSPELISLQHAAEAAGATFHIAPAPRALLGLITANDELLALAEGLLTAPDEVKALLERGHAVLVQPVETGVAAGFERLDLNYASAGVLRIPGRLVEGLVELPPDCDPVSALTRIGLQSGVAMLEVPAASREGARWRLIRDEAEAHAIEGDWLRLHAGARPAPTPINLLAWLGLMKLGPSLLHGGNASRVMLLAGLASILLALGIGWFGFAIVGLLLCGIAALECATAAALRRVERVALGLPAPSLSTDAILCRAIDLTFVVLLVWSIPAAEDVTLLERTFAPLMLLILLRLTPRVVDRNWAPWIEDRLLLSVLLALAAGIGFLVGTVQLMALVLALGGLLLPGGKARIT